MDPPECTGHSHDHDHTDELGLSLRPCVDLPCVRCLNECVQGSGRAILKPHDERMTAVPSLKSPYGDPELLLYIPFTESVNLLSVTIRSVSSSSDTSPPRKVRLFTNRDNLDFESAHDTPAQQDIELLPTHHFVEGTIDYPCRPAGRFQNIQSLTVFFMTNYDDTGENATEVTYFGVKGKGTNVRKRAVETVYEATGMLKDHKVKGEVYGVSSIF